MDPPTSLSQLSFQCPACESSFSSKRSLGVHKRAQTLRAARQNTATRDSVTSPSQPNAQPGPQDAAPHPVSSSNQPVLPSVETSTSADTGTAPAVIPTDTSPTLLVDSAHVHQPDSTASASSLTQDPDEYPPVIDSIRVTDPTNRAFLPSFLPANLIPTQAYNNNSGEVFADSINVIYEEIIRWRKNLFLLPSGQYGKKMITLLSEWIKLYNDDTCFQGIALKVFMVIPALMMQKPSAKSKTRDHVKLLSQRLDLWREGKSEGWVVRW